MFFRRAKPQLYAFAERLDQLREAGFTIQRIADGKAIAIRDGYAAVVEDAGDKPRIARTGKVMGNELADLVELGYQKVWQNTSGDREPTQAAHLETLHDFTEDLRQQLGLVSLYNESLGTVNALHRYDRLTGRDG